ncbi:hypothetical protein P4O66_022976, partial [Electrophorus voltai]
MDDWELPKGEFVLEEQLGSGFVTDVYRGTWKGTWSTLYGPQRVPEGDSGAEKAESAPYDIITESATLQHHRRERHPTTSSQRSPPFDIITESTPYYIITESAPYYIITESAPYYIITESAPYYIITELTEKGNLLSFLRGQEGQSMDLQTLTYMANQVAEGMTYLDEQNSFHRDLAAQNVLMGEDNNCKVANFGLAWIIKERVYLSEDKNIPYKWSPPEAISHGRFSRKSDVWSFGLLLYEIFPYGGCPYP